MQLSLEKLLLAVSRKSLSRTTEANDASPARRSHSTMLIVDPQLLRQKQLRTILRCLGHSPDTIATCKDLNQAEHLMSGQGYESVFVCLSPDESQTLQFIQRQRIEAGNSTRFIAYCPHATREQVLNASLSGASSFLAYPFTAAAVEVALDGESSDPQAIPQILQ
jgi:DNA-binding NtrC family response regulator